MRYNVDASDKRMIPDGCEDIERLQNCYSPLPIGNATKVLSHVLSY